MNIAKFCISHKVATILAVIMITIFGGIFTTQLQMALMPDMEAPMAVVICYYNGASPSDMEELVTRLPLCRFPAWMRFPPPLLTA